MAVAFDAVGPAGGGGTHSATSPLTWTHICSGSATAIVISVSVAATGTSPDITSVTYGGVTCSLLKFENGAGISGEGGCALYYLDSAGGLPTGSNTVSVTFTSGADTVAGSVSVTGSSGHGTAVGGSSSVTTSVSGTVASTTTGGMVVTGASFGGGNGGGTFSGTNSVTIRWQATVSNNTAYDNGVEGTVPSTGGGASQTVGFSNTQSDDWALVAVELLPPASAGPNGTVQPRATVPVPRRYPARGVWRGSAPFLGFVSVAAPKRLPPVPRRTAARGVWAGSKPFLGFVAVPAPPQQPRLLPRRYPARGVWRGSAPFLGFVAVPAPRQEPPVPRRYPSRAVIRGSAPFLGFVAVPAPLRLPPVPRRYPSRAVIQFTPVTTTNALPVVASVSGVLPRLTVNRTEVMSRVTGRVVRR